MTTAAIALKVLDERIRPYLPAYAGFIVGNRAVTRRYLRDARQTASERPPGEVALRVRNLQSGDRVRDVSFDLRCGEILGVALTAAQRHDVADAERPQVVGDLHQRP